MRLALAVLAVVSACKNKPTTAAPEAAPSALVRSSPGGAKPITVVAAGDLSAPTEALQESMVKLVESRSPTAVLLLGDNQYPKGELALYQSRFEPTWGRLKAITHPVPGNHDYATPGAAGYFEYFGARAGVPDAGYYSVEVGPWHVVALNSNDGACGVVPCGEGSAQLEWLKADLAKSKAKCTLAYWHHPRFNSGAHKSNPAMGPFWNVLHDAGVDVVLNGHDHIYERFAPQNPAGEPDEAGITQFTVGTGGISHYRIESEAPNSRVRDADTFGVLELELGEQDYAWRFVPLAPGTLKDEGRATCH